MDNMAVPYKYVRVLLFIWVLSNLSVLSESKPASSSSSTSTTSTGDWSSTSSSSTSVGPAITLPDVADSTYVNYMDIQLLQPSCKHSAVLAWDGLQWQMDHTINIRVVGGVQVFETGFIVVKSHLIISGTKIKLASSSTTLSYGVELQPQLVQAVTIHPKLVTNSAAMNLARSEGHLSTNTSVEEAVRVNLVVESFEGNFRFEPQIASINRCLVTVGEIKELPESFCVDRTSDWKSELGDSCESFRSASLCTSNGQPGTGWNFMMGDFDSVQSKDGISVVDACCACGGGTSIELPGLQNDEPVVNTIPSCQSHDSHEYCNVWAQTSRACETSFMQATCPNTCSDPSCNPREITTSIILHFDPNAAEHSTKEMNGATTSVIAATVVVLVLSVFGGVGYYSLRQKQAKLELEKEKSDHLAEVWQQNMPEVNMIITSNGNCEIEETEMEYESVNDESTFFGGKRPPIAEYSLAAGDDTMTEYEDTDSVPTRGIKVNAVLPEGLLEGLDNLDTCSEVGSNAEEVFQTHEASGFYDNLVDGKVLDDVAAFEPEPSKFQPIYETLSKHSHTGSAKDGDCATLSRTDHKS